jgi:hypothetical protein
MKRCCPAGAPSIYADTYLCTRASKGHTVPTHRCVAPTHLTAHMCAGQPLWQIDHSTAVSRRKPPAACGRQQGKLSSLPAQTESRQQTEGVNPDLWPHAKCVQEGRMLHTLLLSGPTARVFTERLPAGVQTLGNTQANATGANAR